MALRSDKTLKTAIQKFGNLQGRYLWRNLVIAKPYSAVRSNPTYDSEASDFMKLYFETSDSESSRTVSMDLFCENSQRLPLEPRMSSVFKGTKGQPLTISAKLPIIYISIIYHHMCFHHIYLTGSQIHFRKGGWEL